MPDDGGNKTIVSDTMAKKFASEKETPYVRWVRDQGLDIIDSVYVKNLYTTELKPWARREGKGGLPQPRCVSYDQRLLCLRDRSRQKAGPPADVVRRDDHDPVGPRFNDRLER